MRIAITADLHFGHNRLGDEGTHQLLAHLQAQPPDVLLLGGDIGTDEHFEECLILFSSLPGIKAVVPGNHDVWVVDDDHRGNSLGVYEQYLPDLCQRHGYHYLDAAPLILNDAELAIVGTMNWYDYSWSIERMKEEVPNWEFHLVNKLFSRGRHNDGRFVRWDTDDVSFTRRLVVNLETQLVQCLALVEKVIVMTHHPAFRGIAFPRAAPAQGLDELLWEALSGNRSLEELLERHADRIPLVFSGHIHRAVDTTFGPTRGINVGGDYHFKRLLMVDWPTGTIEALTFGDPVRRR